MCAVGCLRRNILEGPGDVVFLPLLGNKVWHVAGSNMLMVPTRSPCTRLAMLMRKHCWAEDPSGVVVQGEQETEGEGTDENRTCASSLSGSRRKPVHLGSRE